MLWVSFCTLSIYACTWLLVDIVFRIKTEEEVQSAEVLTADSVTCLSGLMTDWSGLPDRDMFRLPIPSLTLNSRKCWVSSFIVVFTSFFLSLVWNNLTLSTHLYRHNRPVFCWLEHYYNDTLWPLYSLVTTHCSRACQNERSTPCWFISDFIIIESASC